MGRKTVAPMTGPFGAGTRRAACSIPVALSLLLGACAAIPQQDRALLAADPDCADSATQIAELEALRTSGFRRTFVRMQYLTPDGLLAGVIHDDFDDRRSIVNGSYDAEIDARISEIRETCRA